MQEELLKKEIKKHGLRVTKGRVLVLNCLKSSPRALSQADINERLPIEMDRVSLYRVLHDFESAGILHLVPGEDTVAKYACCESSCTPEHHHDEHVHFQCRQCDGVYCLNTVKAPDFSTLPQGFQVERSQLLLTGLCAQCA